jgi:alpha-beta hydrolase superfamily lysophospholipase
MNRCAANLRWARAALFASGLVLSTIATVSDAQTVETGLVKVADAAIEYFSRGKGEAIVLLPGGTLTVSYLDGLADSLAKSGYRVIGINFRGSGKSTGLSSKRGNAGNFGKRCRGRHR